MFECALFLFFVDLMNQVDSGVFDRFSMQSKHRRRSAGGEEVPSTDGAAIHS